jgi:hypothetical protein
MGLNSTTGIPSIRHVERAFHDFDSRSSDAAIQQSFDPDAGRITPGHADEIKW